MNVQLSEASRRFVAEQVASGRYPSEDAVLEDAIARLRLQGQRPAAPDHDPILGMFRDDPDLVDVIVEEAMTIRETRPWRLPPGE